MTRLNEEIVAALAHLTGDYCRKQRKLVLACDMDDTLITESHLDERVVLRPKVLQMLRALRQYYELCLVTYSTRERTLSILANRLDPSGRLFGQRVLCREDILPAYSTKLDALLAKMPQPNKRASNGGDGLVATASQNTASKKEKLVPINCSNPVENGVNKPTNVYSRSAKLKNSGSTSSGTGSAVRTKRNGSVAGRQIKRNSAAKNLIPLGRRPTAWQFILALDDFPAAWGNHMLCFPIRPFSLSQANVSKSRHFRNESIYMVSLWRFLVRLHAIVFKQSYTPQTLTPLSALSVLPYQMLSSQVCSAVPSKQAINPSPTACTPADVVCPLMTITPALNGNTQRGTSQTSTIGSLCEPSDAAGESHLKRYSSDFPFIQKTPTQTPTCLTIPKFMAVVRRRNAPWHRFQQLCFSEPVQLLNFADTMLATASKFQPLLLPETKSNSSDEAALGARDREKEEAPADLVKKLKSGSSVASSSFYDANDIYLSRYSESRSASYLAGCETDAQDRLQTISMDATSNWENGVFSDATIGCLCFGNQTETGSGTSVTIGPALPARYTMFVDKFKDRAIEFGLNNLSGNEFAIESMTNTLSSQQQQPHSLDQSNRQAKQLLQQQYRNQTSFNTRRSFTNKLTDANAGQVNLVAIFSSQVEPSDTTVSTVTERRCRKALMIDGSSSLSNEVNGEEQSLGNTSINWPNLTLTNSLASARDGRSGAGVGRTQNSAGGSGGGVGGAGAGLASNNDDLLLQSSPESNQMIKHTYKRARLMRL